MRKRTATVFAMMFRSYAGTWNPNMHWTTAAKLDQGEERTRSGVPAAAPTHQYPSGTDIVPSRRDTAWHTQPTKPVYAQKSKALCRVLRAQSRPYPELVFDRLLRRPVWRRPGETVGHENAHQSRHHFCSPRCELRKPALRPMRMFAVANLAPWEATPLDPDRSRSNLNLTIPAY